MSITTLSFSPRRYTPARSAGSIATLLLVAGSALFALSIAQAQPQAEPQAQPQAQPQAPQAGPPVKEAAPALAPPGAQTAPAAPPPSWQQGRSAEQAKSPLHPIAPILTGRPAKELAHDKLK